MEVVSPVVPGAEAAELMEPSQGSFDRPPQRAESAAVLGVSFREHWFDAALAELLAVRLGVVSAVALHDVGPLPGPSRLAGNRGNGVDQRRQLRDVMHVGAGEDRRQRNACGVGDEVMLAAAFAAIGRVRPGFLPPVTALSMALSARDRDQSMRSAACNFESSNRCNSCQTPACCQSRSRRQQVMPHPQPISRGKSSQAMPVFSTNKMPASASRLPIGGRPPCGERFCGGNSGETSSHNSSETSGLAIDPLLDRKIVSDEKRSS
jgi:hypothetical protein